MAYSGTAEIDFGAFPGAYSAIKNIIDQGAIQAGSIVEAWIFPTATVDHTVSEHLTDAPSIMAYNVVAGIGFTIYGATQDTAKVYGKWTVAWAWRT